MDEKDIIKLLDTYFNREAPPKFVNVSRVPLICQDIKFIKNTLEEMKEAIKIKESDHEERIRDVENNQWKIGAIIGTVSAGIGYIASRLFK